MADDPFASTHDTALRPQRAPMQWPRSLKAWVVERRLDRIAAAAIAAFASALLFATGNLLRTPCDTTCPAYAGLPASLIETLGITALLLALAAAGAWIAQITQRTWLERMRLRRVEMRLEETADEPRLRRLEALLDDDSDVPSIQAQARLYLWSGLPAGTVAVLLLPYALGTFGDMDQGAAYMLPIILLTIVAGGAAMARGIALTAAARRLTRPLQPVREQKEHPRKKPRGRAAKPPA